MAELNDQRDGCKAKQPPNGFLALVGAFDDAPEYADELDRIVAARRSERPRPALLRFELLD